MRLHRYAVSVASRHGFVASPQERMAACLLACHSKALYPGNSVTSLTSLLWSGVESQMASTVHPVHHEDFQVVDIAVSGHPGMSSAAMVFSKPVESRVVRRQRHNKL